MHIPIIILNWNGYGDTVECVESVLQSDYSEFTIYLVDNGSDANEGRRLSDLFLGEKRVAVRCLNSNLGFAKANNILIEELSPSHDVIVLLNNDTTVDPAWLHKLVEARAASHADMLSVKLLNYFDRTKIDNLGHQMLNTGEVVPIAHGEEGRDYNISFENFGSCAGAAMLSCKMMNRIGAFDPNFSTGYEDAELGVRAFVAGYKCIFVPDAIVYHKMGQSIKKVFDERYALMIQTSIWYTYLKLMPTSVIIISAPFILFKHCLLTLINLVFWRPKYLKIQWEAVNNVLQLYPDKIKENRHAFLENYRSRSSFSILAAQRFFLWFDILRFYRIFIRRKKSALDKYGGT